MCSREIVIREYRSERKSRFKKKESHVPNCSGVYACPCQEPGYILQYWRRDSQGMLKHVIGIRRKSGRSEKNEE